MRLPCALLVAFFSFVRLPAQDIKIEIDPSAPLMTSPFQIGVTHTHGFWEYGNPAAVERARNLLINGIAFQNQHIMGWGAGNPEPQPGLFYWNDMDHRVDLMRSLDAPMIITFCTAPGWMKGTDDWAMEEDVADGHVEEFAGLCAAVAARYPDVEYFQIWNEMKGYWSGSLNNWDYVRYTKCYNAVYDAVKAERPDAKVGGPYLVIQGDGGVELGKSGRDTFKPIGNRDWAVINYWLKNKNGADFICFDYGLIDYHDSNTYTRADQMKLTKNFGSISAQLAEKTDLPVVISEFYGGNDKADQKFTAANHASCYYHAIRNHTSLGLIWNPQEGEIDNYLFTKTESSSGGQPSAHYRVVQAINRYFSKGTRIYSATSSSEDVEVLSSAEKTMLINKTEDELELDVHGEIVRLDGYEVKVIDTPAGGRDRFNGASEIDIIYSSSGPLLRLNPHVSTRIQMRVFNVLGKKLEDRDYFINSNSTTTVRIFDQSAGRSSGIYFVSIRGTGIRSVKRFYWLK